MVEKRAKIRVEHPQKLFYEKLLRAWRESVDDKNQKFTIYKAYTHLRNYPLEVSRITDLKQIHGIGETLAVRCYSAWEVASAAYSPNCDIKTIKQMKNEELISFMEKGRKLKVSPTSNSGRTVIATSAPRHCEDPPEEVAPHQITPQVLAQTVADENGAYSESRKEDDSKSEDSSSQEYGINEVQYVTCQPSDRAEVILIADNREDHGARGGSSVVEFLNTTSYRVETRTLSIGDYLWVLRRIDGSEMVLDWVVERKTWDDLFQSIRLGRYEEQKQRLCRSPMKNRVYLVEGKFIPKYAPCEQALATTMVMHGFMVQKTKSPKETADFLCRITDHLEATTNARQITGVSYESLQELSKKASADTVRDIWVRQLMVCPGMSSERAQKVADRFPSMAAMMSKYSEVGTVDADSLVHSVVPEINRPISAQLRKFFASVVPFASGSDSEK